MSMLGWIDDVGTLFVARCRCGWSSDECSWPTTAASRLADHLDDVRDPTHGHTARAVLA